MNNGTEFSIHDIQKIEFEKKYNRIKITTKDYMERENKVNITLFPDEQQELITKYSNKTNEYECKHKSYSTILDCADISIHKVNAILIEEKIRENGKAYARSIIILNQDMTFFIELHLFSNKKDKLLIDF